MDFGLHQLRPIRFYKKVTSNSYQKINLNDVLHEGKKSETSMLILILITILLALVTLGIGYYFSNQVLRVNYAKQGSIRVANLENLEVFQDFSKKMRGEKFIVQSDFGYKLVGKFFPAKKSSTKIMILAHGFGGYKETMTAYAKMFLELGFHVIVYDHRNSGESGGNTITAGIHESKDMKKIVDYAKSKLDPGSQIGIFGISMGAATTLLYAGCIEDGADFYIVDCPYTDFFTEAMYRLQEEFSYIPSFARKVVAHLGNLFIQWRSGINILDASPINVVADIQSPVLFINTKMDTYIPPYMTQELYNKKQGTKFIRWFEKGDHGKAISLYPDEYKQEVIKFLANIHFNLDEQIYS